MHSDTHSRDRLGHRWAGVSAVPGHVGTAVRAIPAGPAPHETVRVEAITYRAAGADDIEAVLEFWKRSAEDANRPADSTDAVARLLVRDPDAMILACHEGGIVGTIIAGWDGWRCHIHRLAVDPDHRRSGIGRSLVARAEARFSAAGGSRSDAFVHEANALGHRTWETLGYVRQFEWARWVKPLGPPR